MTHVSRSRAFTLLGPRAAGLTAEFAADEVFEDISRTSFEARVLCPAAMSTQASVGSKYFVQVFMVLPP
jgi:hypothetical protein